jgi:hypothetical protein
MFYYSGGLTYGSTTTSDNMRAPEPFMTQTSQATGEMKISIDENETNVTNTTNSTLRP